MITYSRKDYKVGCLLIIIAGIFWGLDGVALTPRLYSLDTSFVVLMLHLVPFIVMTLLFGRKEVPIILKTPNKTLFLFFLIALFGGALGTLAIVKSLFIVGFKELTIVNLIQKLQPIFAFLLARILLKERMSKTFFLYAFIAIGAGYLLTFGFSLPNLNDDYSLVLACFYSALAALSFGSSTVLGKLSVELGMPLLLLLCLSYVFLQKPFMIFIELHLPIYFYFF